MDKKERIINAAIKLFGEKGIENTKISDIAKEARIAQGTFYLYFPSKLSVMPAIADVMISEMIQSIRSNVSTDLDFFGKIEQLIDTVFEVTEKHKELVGIIYAGLSASDFLDEWVDAYEPYYSWLTNLLDSANKNNEIHLVIDSLQTAKILWGLIEAAAERAYLFDEKEKNLILQDKKDVLIFIKKALTR
ncbi:TetR family transcriptional regulator [Ureibacillus manganicus]|uniref:TetR family transcriptional regulator n=1 Tax=Ureibacillus manganicus DSM 26584 TaxID=1384049 RepID=A0A0A3I8I1_9BACL|nr:TetR family transcriptional regulator [Ureibacillus manganicus]KGR79068.1 TetR family transcriptional regulator [Ureibacillus manganicus DSM 26584]